MKQKVYETVVVEDGESVRDLEIHVPADKDGLIVKGTKNGCNIDNVDIIGGQYGIVAHGAGHTMTRVRAFNPAKYGIITQGGASYSTDTTISEFHVEGAGQSGVGALGIQRGVTFRDGVVYNCGLDGVTGYDTGNDRVRVIRVDIDGVTGHGIHIGGINPHVEHCNIKNYGASHAGIYFQSHDDVHDDMATLVGSHMNGSTGRYGVWVRKYHRFHLSGGVFAFNADWHGLNLEYVTTAVVDGLWTWGSRTNHSIRKYQVGKLVEGSNVLHTAIHTS